MLGKKLSCFPHVVSINRTDMFLLELHIVSHLLVLLHSLGRGCNCHRLSRTFVV